jgi:hypothetical protein
MSPKYTCLFLYNHHVSYTLPRKLKQLIDPQEIQRITVPQASHVPGHVAIEAMPITIASALSRPIGISIVLVRLHIYEFSIFSLTSPLSPLNHHLKLFHLTVKLDIMELLC